MNHALGILPLSGWPYVNASICGNDLLAFLRIRRNYLGRAQSGNFLASECNFNDYLPFNQVTRTL